MWVNMDIGTDIFATWKREGIYGTDKRVYLSLRNGMNMCRIVIRVILVILLCLIAAYSLVMYNAANLKNEVSCIFAV